MAVNPKILAFAGSTRTDSYNKRLVKIAVAGALAAVGEVTLIDLRDFPLPLFDGDLEARDGLPANGRKLKDLFLQNIKVIVLPDQIAVPKAAESFNPDGSRKDPKQQAAVEGLGTKLVQVIAKLRS